MGRVTLDNLQKDAAKKNIISRRSNNRYDDEVNLLAESRSESLSEESESSSPRPEQSDPNNHLKKTDPAEKAHKENDALEKKMDPLNKKLKRRKEKEAKKSTAATESQQTSNKESTTSQPSSNNLTTTKQQSSNKNFRMASRMEYLMQKGLPKQITRFIAGNAAIEGESWVCYFNSSDFLEAYNLEKKKIKQVANAIDRMKKVGWFTVTDSSKGGMRRLEIDPSIYGL
mgnify:CR=1 FL=1